MEPAVALTTDLSRDDAIPYFLWDEPMTLGELRRVLDHSDEDRIRMLGKILREAREEDVWLFTTPEEISRRWDQLSRYLGRRRDFWTFLLSRWREQGLLEKITIGRIIIDSPGEILANKLRALLSRAEVRDLVDVARLEEAGHDPIAAVALAQQKDGGMSPGQLAWVLSEFSLPSDENLHYGMTGTELRDYRESLIRRLTAEAFPGRPE